MHAMSKWCRFINLCVGDGEGKQENHLVRSLRLAIMVTIVCFFCRLCIQEQLKLPKGK